MKKLNLLLLMFLTTGLFAQQDDSWANDSQSNSSSVSNGGVFKQEAGNKSLEILFNPAGIFRENGGDVLNLSNGGAIKFRSFTGDNSAFRLVVGLQYSSLSSITQQEDSDADELELKNISKKMGISLSPGFEKHFSGSNKLSPYVGGQAILGYFKTSLVSQYQSGNDVESVTLVNVSEDDGGLGNGYLQFGVGVFSGVDWYFTQKLYLGAELGFNISYAILSNSEYIDSNDSDRNNEYKNGSGFNLSPSILKGGFRLGWTF